MEFRQKFRMKDSSSPPPPSKDSCVSRPSNQHPVRLILHPITFRRLAFKGPSAVFILACQLSSSTTLTPPRTVRNRLSQSFLPYCRNACLAPWLISSLSQLWASGKRIKNSYTSPAKRRRGSPASSPAPAAASPGLVSPAVSPSIFIPQTDHPTNFSGRAPFNSWWWLAFIHHWLCSIVMFPFCRTLLSAPVSRG
ncbi:hypothetical protein ILYODFUR_037958 [Ilyodon furcidens]|uniref:Uncharacterized protein n=1 Tax=Ilyodon furcidens TaxID=33524 RepID=A0ABV0T5W1_9TELE